MPAPCNRRRNRLPQPRFQLRLIGAFLGMTLLGMVLQFVLLGARLLELANRLPSDGALLSDSLPSLLLVALGLSLLTILPAILVVGVYLTFRWAGPLYRFHHHFEEVAAGRDPGPCRLRNGDELQDLCGLINRALDAAREQGNAHRAGDDTSAPSSEAA